MKFWLNEAQSGIKITGRNINKLRYADDTTLMTEGLPLWLSWKRICLQYGRPGFDPWVGKMPWRREKPGFWPGEFHGLCSPWCRKESDTTEWVSLSLYGRKQRGTEVHLDESERGEWKKKNGLKLNIWKTKIVAFSHYQEAFNRRLPVCCFGSVRNPLFLIHSWIFRN